MTQPQVQTQVRTARRYFTKKRLAVSLAVLAVMIILFGVLGYFWLPGYAKSQLELRLSELLERPVSVRAIEIKPYTLELTVNGFRIDQRQDSVDAGQPFVSFEKLHVDISGVTSITRRAPVISTITLDALYARLSRDGDNQFNFSDLIEKFSQPEDEEDTAALFSVSNIVLRDGRIEWIDRVEQNHQEISEINFAIPFVANFDKVKANWVEPHFSAKVNGAPFKLDGKVRPFTDKREATLSLKLNDVDLNHMVEYMPFPAGIRLTSGYFDTDLTVTFSQSGDGEPVISLSGSTQLRQLGVNNKAVEAPYQLNLSSFQLGLDEFDLTGRKPSQLAVRLNDLAMIPEGIHDGGNNGAVISMSQLITDGMTVDLTGQKVSIKSVTLDSFSTRIQREEGGHIDLLRFLTPSEYDFSDISEEDDIYLVVSSDPVPRHKPSDEAYQAWLQDSQDQTLSVAQQTTVSIPLPGRKPTDDERTELVQQSENQSENEPVNDEAGSWQVQIDQFRLNDAAIRYADLSLTDIAPLVVEPLDLTVTNIDITGETPLELNMAAQVNEHGAIEADGALAWAPLAADLNLNVQSVDLVALQGWAKDMLNVLLTDGDFSFQGTVKAEGEPLKLAVNGQSRLGDFNLVDQKNSVDLVRWKLLDVGGLDFVNDPLTITVDTIKLDNFFARAVLLPDGELNLTQIVKQDETTTAVDDQAIEATEQTDEPSPMPLHIGKILLRGGHVDFHDRFVKPNYQVNLTGLHGQVGPVDANRPGSIDVKGQVDGAAPLEVRGQIAPADTQLSLDIAAKAKEIDLPQFSPYSGKYVGYMIEKGKLSVDVHYQIKQGVLTAENNIFLDQLTFGEAVESEEALSLPLELAVALLKNRHGEIDIHLPVEGSLDDPQFSLGSIVLDALINLITKAVTSPFALLGAVLGESEELSEIQFSPGLATIEPNAVNQLQGLSEALNDRPALQLEIAGFVDPVEDYEGLKTVILLRQVKAQKLAADAKTGTTSGSIAEVTLTQEEYSKFLEKIYKQADFEKQKNFLGMTKSLPDDEMEQLLEAHIEVSDGELQELAQDRAVAVQNWLQDVGGVSADRLFVLGEQTAASDGDRAGHRVEFTLK